MTEVLSQKAGSDSDKKERLLIQGLSGKRSLRGSISVRGAKNAALKALAGAILFEDELTLWNVPSIEDITSLLSILKELGVSVKKKGESACSLRAGKGIKTHLSPPLAKRLRASIVLTGPLLARYGKVSFPHPGGCVIGARPIDIFIDGFTKMGATVKEDGDSYEVVAPTGGLRGAELLFKNPSVTATETLMMAGVLAKGKTILKNAAREPEIKILADFLNECGAEIQGAGTTTIEIKGGGLLHARQSAIVPAPRRRVGHADRGRRPPRAGGPAAAQAQGQVQGRLRPD